VRPPGAVSPTRETINGVEILLLAASRGPNSIALAYTRNDDLGCVEMRQLNFVVSTPKFTKFLCRTLEEL